MDRELQQLLELARNQRMDEASKARQRISFAFGNANIENERVTRAVVQKMADELLDQA